jgi:tRNA-dihydrouridine synthase
VQSNNATEPGPAIAPGVEHIDVAAFAAALGSRPEGPIDPRVPALVPGFDAPFFQAGLAGYSDAAMRIIARRHGCPFCVTEALLDRTLLAGGKGFVKADLGELHDNVPGGVEDHPLAGQIMGSEPAEMAAAALKMVEQSKRGDRAYREMAYAGRNVEFALDVSRSPKHDPTEGLGDSCEGEAEGCEDESCDPLDHEIELDEASGASDSPNAESRMPNARISSQGPGGFEVIDVNLACPVKKIEKKARGGHWLTEPEGAIAILKAVREAVPSHIPCAVKMRRSFDDTPEMVENFERIFEAAYAMGYAWATVHARTVVQKYVGPSRWTFLRELRQRHPDKIILGSGDVWEVRDIFRMLAYTGVSGVSVARGCIGNPWIFRQARQMLAGQEPTPPTLMEQRRALEEHFQLSLATTRRFRHGEEATSRMMRKFAIRFSTHHPKAEEVRVRFIAVSSLKDWRAVLDEFYPV